MHVVDTRIAYATPLGADTYLVGFRAPSIAEDARPGQFVQVRFPGSRELLLPRAFSVMAAGVYCTNAEEADVELLVRVVGPGTRAVVRRPPDEPVQVSGPIGNVFEIGSEVRKVCVVAGGVGFAPVHFLAADLCANRSDIQVDFFYGAKTARELVAGDLINRLPVARHDATDDGSAGFKGFVTDALRESLENADPAVTLLCGCGPAPMLRALQRLSIERGLTCLVSLENYMACGTGVCQGCAVNVGTEDAPVYERVCREGPVFDAARVRILELSHK